MNFPTRFEKGCVCRATGMVQVRSDGESFFTASGMTVPEGKLVIVACTCRFGDLLNARRRDELKFSVYDASWMVTEGNENPVRKPMPVATGDGWGDLPERNEDDYRPREPGEEG